MSTVLGKKRSRDDRHNIEAKLPKGLEFLPPEIQVIFIKLTQEPEKDITPPAQEISHAQEIYGHPKGHNSWVDYVQASQAKQQSPNLSAQEAMRSTLINKVSSPERNDYLRVVISRFNANARTTSQTPVMVGSR